jgi:thiamine pyrophosphate-dependent acetolactate synthase large subunit-like protein
MNSDNFTTYSRPEIKTMNRADLTRRLVHKLKKDEAVIGGIGNANFDLWTSGQRPQNFYMLASMGLAVPISLGVAIAQPDRRVIALEGDGSILMQVGALGTVAAMRQKNLAIVIFDNGVFQLTGSQRTLTSYGSDVVAMAKGAGIRQSFWAIDETHFETLMDRALNEDGPWLIGACIDGKPAEGQTERDAIKIRMGFMQGMGAAS